MSRIIRLLLRRFGYQVSRIRASTAPTPSPVHPSEIADVEKVLKWFAAQQPTTSDWADFQALRDYLSNRRIHFFQEVISCCKRYEVDLEGKRVADVGSGMGYLLRLAHREAPSAQLVGYDTFAEAMELAKALCPHAQFYNQSLFEIEEIHDVVFCTEVLEHLLKPEEALQRLFSMVSAGGRLVFTVPNGRKNQLEAGEKREDGTAYWGHIHFWSPESWPLLLKRELQQASQIECGNLATGENYAVVSR